MHFALINNNRVEAQPQLKGLCSCCSKPVIAKCGTRKIWHWAHKSKTDCDNWWEPETEWHRTWKNNYPTDCQEIALLDERTGEKHIADVRTIHNLIIEFQHSHIDPQERASREQFHKKTFGIRATGKQHLETGEFDKSTLKFVELVEYQPRYDERYLNELREKASKSWAGITDVDKWLREIRGYEVIPKPTYKVITYV